MLPLALGLAASLFYLAFHSAFYNFDGVACAIAVELGDLAHLAHGNHLAYGLVGLAFDRLWRLFGYSGPALLTLQTLDSLLGGAGVGLFCSLLSRRLKLPALTAALGASALAVSFAWWFWSLEAQVYVLGAFFVLLSADAALAEKPRPVALGLLLGAAVLGHVGNLMFLPAAVSLLRARGAGRRELALFAAALTAALLAAYAGAAVFCVKPRDLAEWRSWLLGSAALNVDRAFTWYSSPPLEALRSWSQMTLRVFCDAEAAPAPWRPLGWVLGALPVAAAAWTARAGAPREAVRAALLWLAGYALLFMTWQPFTMVYRMTDLPALWLLAALAVGASRPRAALLAVWVLAAGAFNLRFLILPQTDPSRNAEHQEAVWLGGKTEPDDWIVTTARGQVYVPYFAHRRPLNLRYFMDRPGALAARVAALERGGARIFITEETLSTGDFRKELEDYGLSESAREGARVLYRIKRKESRAAGARRS